MNGCDEICVVCGEASAELICRACQALIGAKPLRAVEACTTILPEGAQAGARYRAYTTEAGMDGWWDELDEEILEILKAGGPIETEELAAKLGMSTDAVCSCLSLLATGGRVRIRSVEVRPDRRLDARAA